MIRSMTGYGKGAARFGPGTITVEIKTVNHKFFEPTLKLPNHASLLDDRIKEVLQKKIRRGKINLNLALNGAALNGERININKKTAKNYYDELKNLGKFLGIKDEIATKDLVLLPGVVSFESAEDSLAKIWPRVKEALDKALEALLRDREKEGRALETDLSKRTKRIRAMLAVIKSRADLNINEHRKRFAERIKDLAGGREIDRGRLEIEVAIFAKNSDISEEITRLENHLANLTRALSSYGEVGKKLDFIAQELHREINTIGSKASDFKIAKNVIEIKSEIEKIREQAKNLE